MHPYLTLSIAKDQLKGKEILRLECKYKNSKNIEQLKYHIPPQKIEDEDVLMSCDQEQIEFKKKKRRLLFFFFLMIDDAAFNLVGYSSTQLT